MRSYPILAIILSLFYMILSEQNPTFLVSLNVVNKYIHTETFNKSYLNNCCYILFTCLFSNSCICISGKCLVTVE